MPSEDYSKFITWMKEKAQKAPFYHEEHYSKPFTGNQAECVETLLKIKKELAHIGNLKRIFDLCQEFAKDPKTK
jgi:hypothetical protein